LSAGLTHRQTALLAVERTCPRCAAFRRGASDYCLECGLRLPELRGTIPSLRRRWVRRIGWYPGDWIWVPLLALVLAAAGTVAAIAVTRHRAGGETTLVATAATPAVAATGAGSARNGHLTWPAGRSGWTVILVSYPSPKGRKTALAVAVRAARAQLTQVGTLASGSFASLNPGYTIVFSGIFATAASAENALRRARQAGFDGAHTAQIAR
jgi:hypothetical protein